MVVVFGTLFCSDGTEIPLYEGSASNGTEVSVNTNTDVSVVVMDAGTYATGKTVVAYSPFMGTNNVSYAYLLRRGEIIQTYSGGAPGTSSVSSVKCSKPIVLQAGDTVRVMPVAAADRECTLTTYTAQGNCHIFSVTPTGAATNTLVSILNTNNGIGDTLQGQTIIKAFSTSVDGIKLTFGGGVYILNDKGAIVGAVQSTDNTNVQPMFSDVKIPIGLNFAAQAKTSA